MPEWVSLIISIVILLIPIVYGYGKINEKISNLETNMKDLEEYQKDIITMKSDIGYIKKDMQEIKNFIRGPK